MRRRRHCRQPEHVDVGGLDSALDVAAEGIVAVLRLFRVEEVVRPARVPAHVAGHVEAPVEICARELREGTREGVLREAALIERRHGPPPAASEAAIGVVRELMQLGRATKSLQPRPDAVDDRAEPDSRLRGKWGGRGGTGLRYPSGHPRRRVARASRHEGEERHVAVRAGDGQPRAVGAERQLSAHGDEQRRADEEELRLVARPGDVRHGAMEKHLARAVRFREGGGHVGGGDHDRLDRVVGEVGGAAGVEPLLAGEPCGEGAVDDEREAAPRVHHRHPHAYPFAVAGTEADEDSGAV